MRVLLSSLLEQDAVYFPLEKKGEFSTRCEESALSLAPRSSAWETRSPTLNYGYGPSGAASQTAPSGRR